MEQKVNMTSDKTQLLTKKDLRGTFSMWFFTTELSNSYERLQALAFCNAISKNLEKLYKDDHEAYVEALTRHLQFYNSEGTIGCITLGVALSMEEEKALGSDVPPEMITGIKTGLMGPIAGIGDTIIWGTIKPIIMGLGSSFALAGNPLGAFIIFLYPLVIVIVGYNMLNFGYKVGKESVMSLLKSGMINKIITGASILGLFMMGALSSTYVKVSTPLSWEIAGAKPIVLQEILDAILPGMLPLIAIFGIVWYFKNKGGNYNRVLFFVIILSLVGAFFGVLA